MRPFSALSHFPYPPPLYLAGGQCICSGLWPFPSDPSIHLPLPLQVGLFAAGCGPSAAADPYGLRRAAYGMLQVRKATGVNPDI